MKRRGPLAGLRVIDASRVLAGPLFTLAAPYLFDGERPRPYLPPPALGEHTEEILKEVELKPRRT